MRAQKIVDENVVTLLSSEYQIIQLGILHNPFTTVIFQLEENKVLMDANKEYPGNKHM